MEAWTATDALMFDAGCADQGLTLREKRQELGSRKR